MNTKFARSQRITIYIGGQPAATWMKPLSSTYKQKVIKIEIIAGIK